MKLDFDCIIIGAGVAGMTSALYLKRAGIDVAIIEKNYVGGQINKTNIIENYPGFQKIDGPTFSLTIESQLKSLDVPIIYRNVLDIKEKEEIKEVITDKETYKAKAIVVATGKTERKLGLPFESELTGHGVSYCATCDGNFYKNRDVAIVGAGNTAMEEALYLSNICSKVYLINRTNLFPKADNILLEKVKNKENITIITNSVVTTLLQNNQTLSGIVLNDNRQLNVAGLFIAIGSIPDISFLRNLNLETENEYIIVNNHMETNIKGIFACGDIIKKDLYQIITAASDGAIAANSVKKYLLER